MITMAGGAIAFMGVFAGISKWVAEPAARKVLAEHTNMGNRSHQEYVSREEWDRKHSELVTQMNGIEKVLATLTAALMKNEKVK